MTPEEESGVSGEKQIDDLLMQMEKCKSSICFSSVLPESSFRRHRNKKGAKLEEVLNKVGWDYYIGEYKEGKRHEHGWFAYIAIIYNTFELNSISYFNLFTLTISIRFFWILQSLNYKWLFNRSE